MLEMVEELDDLRLLFELASGSVLIDEELRVGLVESLRKVGAAYRELVIENARLREPGKIVALQSPASGRVVPFHILTQGDLTQDEVQNVQ